MFLTESNLVNPSVLTSLLRSAHAISKEDRRVIRLLVEQKTAHLSALGDEIVEVKQQIALANAQKPPPPQAAALYPFLQELEEIHQNMIPLISQLKSLISPVRRLPPELLSRIFVYTLPDDRFTRPAATRSPLLLCAVSASWRSLAVENPLLWTSLAISSCKDGHCKPNPALVHLWIARSGGFLPLDLSIAWSSNSTTTGIQSVWSTLMSHIHRWRHFKLLLLSPSAFFTFVPPIPAELVDTNLNGSLPHASVGLPTQLRTFTFRSVDLTDSAEAWLATTLGRCRDLKQLEWCVSLAEEHPLPSLNCASSLTTLRLDGRSYAETLRTMFLCPNLEECRLRMVHDGFSPADDALMVQNVMLPKLKALEIRTGSTYAIHFLLDRLSAPNLEKLRISGDCLTQLTPAQHATLVITPPIFTSTSTITAFPFELPNGTPLEHFLTRSQPPLQALYLHPTSRVSSSNLIPVLHLLPRLNILHMGSDFVIDDDFLIALTLPPAILTYCDQDIDMEQLPSLSSNHGAREEISQHPCLCPELDWLVLERSSYNCQDGLLSAMVQSRCQIAAPGTKRHHIPDPLHIGNSTRSCPCCTEGRESSRYPLTPPRSRSPSLDSTNSYSSLDSWAYHHVPPPSRGLDILPSPPPSPPINPTIVLGARLTPFMLHATIPASHSRDRAALARVRASRTGL